MAKYYGEIGYAESTNPSPGVYKETIVERKYYGEIIKNSGRIQLSGQVNEDLQVSSQISIISDPYAVSNYQNIRYAIMNGAKWKVTNVDIQYPRLIMTLGGLYNGST